MSMYDELTLTRSQRWELTIRERNVAAIKKTAQNLRNLAEYLTKQADELTESFNKTGDPIGSISNNFTWVRNAIHNHERDIVDTLIHLGHNMQERARHSFGLDRTGGFKDELILKDEGFFRDSGYEEAQKRAEEYHEANVKAVHAAYEKLNEGTPLTDTENELISAYHKAEEVKAKKAEAQKQWEIEHAKREKYRKAAEKRKATIAKKKAEAEKAAKAQK